MDKMTLNYTPTIGSEHVVLVAAVVYSDVMTSVASNQTYSDVVVDGESLSRIEPVFVLASDSFPIMTVKSLPLSGANTRRHPRRFSPPAANTNGSRLRGVPA